MYAALKITISNRKAQGGESKIPTLYLYALNNYFPDPIIKRFERENHCHVQYDFFASGEEMLAKLQAGATGYDVLIPSDFIIKALVASDLLLDLDRNRISNKINIADDLRRGPYDPEEKYTMPYKWGTTGFVYNSKFVHETLETWNQVFQQKYTGRIALMDSQREAIGSQLQNLGYSINSINREELEKARKLLMSRKSMIRMFSNDARQLLLTGDIWIAQTYSGDAMQIEKDNPAFKYSTTSEGGIFWVDVMAISKTSKNLDLAYKFINYILQPDVEYQNVKTLFYSSPNKMVENTDLRPVLKASYIKKLNMKKMEYIDDLGIVTQLWDQIWTEIKSE